MDDSQIICYCSNVTRGQIVAAIEKGARTLADIQRMTSACTVGDCERLSPKKKCCAPDVVAILNEYLKK